MVDREQSLGQGFEPEPRKKISRSATLLVGSVSTALVVGPISPTIGGVAVAVAAGTGIYKAGRLVYRRYVHRENSK